MALNLTPLATLIIKQVAPPIIEKIKNKISPDELQRAILAGIKAAEAEDENLPNEQHLFLNSKPDSLQSVPGFFGKYFQLSGVQGELAKTFNDEGLLDVDYLAENFHQVAENFSAVNLITGRVKPWLNTFANTYFQETNYLRFKVAKEDYFKQLNKRYDDIKFAGIAVSGQEEDRKRLQQIFVMPDVVERESNKQPLPDIFIDEQLTPQQRLISEQRQLARLSTTSNHPFLANKLLTETKSKKAVILGAPGSGKSTLVSYFAVMLAQGNAGELGLDKDTDWLPIVIEIRDLERNLHLNFLEYLHQFAESNLTTKTLPQDFFKHWLERDKALILLDGIDEVAETGKRYEVVQRIELFLNQYEGNIAIITSRPSGYRRDFFSTAEFPHYQLQPFDNRKIEQFINHWYDSRYDDPQEATRCKNTLRKALEDNNRIKLLAKNPLLITIIALIHRYQAYLPKERHKLYDKAVETLLISWDTKKAISGHKALKYLDLDDLRRLLESLAHWIHAQGSTGDKEGGTQIDRDELLSWLSQYIKINKDKKLYEAREEAERFLNFIRERTGLLNEQGTNRYAFVHKTFQEYLCAQDINYEADDDDDFAIILNCIKENLHKAHWREVLLLLVAQQKPQKALKAIKTIYEHNSEYEQWLHRDLLFAGSCLADSPKGMAVKDKNGLGVAIIKALVDLEIADNHDIGNKVRQQIFKIISSLAETEWEAETLDLLKQQKRKIGQVDFILYQAVLGEIDFAINALLSFLRDDNFTVRFLAAEALANIGNKEFQVMEALLSLLRDDDFIVRLLTAEALANIGSNEPRIISTLINLLQDDNSIVRSRGAEALGKIGNNELQVIEALLNLLQDDNLIVRSSAGEALGKIGNNEPQIISTLLNLLRDDNSDVRSSAAHELGKMVKGEEPQVINALLNLLRDDNSDVRSRAAYALTNIGNNEPQVINALLNLLRDERSEVRSSAAEALGKIGSNKPQVINALLNLLRDDNSDVRSPVASALGKIGSNKPQVINALLNLLLDDDWIVRSRAAYALTNIGNNRPQVINALLNLLRDERSEVRSSAAGALGNMGRGEPQVIEALLSLLRDDSSEVRSSVAHELGNMGESEPQVIEALLSLLRDDNSMVRYSAAGALGNIGKGEPQAINLIVNWIEQYQNTNYVGGGIDVLWNLVVDAD